ncbi:MAG: glycosyltransferase family 2 protein [Prevotella sp.]|nr:glycosyltransferase family 2 protein [Prevotella sp.]
MSNEILPLVSVVVPVHNTELYLQECIESLIKQTYRPLEIILVDDGSTDSSGNICDYYKGNTLIKIIHTKSQGMTEARVTGFKQASGDYVTLVDADDFVAPSYVEHLLTCLLKYDVDISCCQSYNVYGKHNSYVTRTEMGLFDQKGIKRILTSNYLFDVRSGIASVPHYIWSKLYKREILEQTLPIGIGLWGAEDAVTIFSSFLLSKSIYISKEPLYYYRQHPTQLTKKMDRKRWDANTNCFEALSNADTNNLLRFQLPLYILALLRDWLKVRYMVSNSYREFKSDMAYALNKEPIERLFIHKHISTTNKRHLILAFLAQHKLYFLYYIFLKVHVAVLKKINISPKQPINLS